MSFLESTDARKRLMVAFLNYCENKKSAHYSPSGYLPWNNFLNVLLESLDRNADRLIADELIQDYGDKIFLGACSAIAELDAPVRYVSSELAAAWANTTLPRFHFNHPHVLPAFILFPPLKNSAFEVWPKNQIIAQVVMELVGGGIAAFSLETRAKGKNIVEVGGSATVLMPDQCYDHLSSLDRQAAALALNAWLVHTYEPELITTESITSRPGAGFGKCTSRKHAPLPPTWIGRDFKVRRTGPAAPTGEAGIKVRPHWRSGHWHTVRHGKGRQEERLQWYRPVYVNA